MRRMALLVGAGVTTLALATPTLTTAASAAPDAHARHGHAAVSVAKKKKPSLKLQRASKGVQPGIAAQKITAKVNGGGKVKFELTGTGVELKAKVKVKKGKAVYDVPPLVTGKYKVTAKYGKKKAKTSFEVYDSALTVNATAFTVSYADPYTNVVPLTGSVKYKGKAATKGYVDLYLNGDNAGGSSSPNLLGFGTVLGDGTFSYDSFATRVATKYGPGTYNFQAYYTDGPEFGDYISSNFIVVTVTP